MGPLKRPSDGGATVTVPPKRLRVGSPTARRSQRTGKGIGGATEQLKKVGAAVAPGKKKKPDQFVTFGELPNAMAPESLGQRTKRVSG